MGGPRPWAEAPVAAPLISKLKRKKSPTCLNRYHWHQFRNLLNTFWENFLWGGMIKMINEHWSYHTFIMMTRLLKVWLNHLNTDDDQDADDTLESAAEQQQRRHPRTGHSGKFDAKLVCWGAFESNTWHKWSSAWLKDLLRAHKLIKSNRPCDHCHLICIIVPIGIWNTGWLTGDVHGWNPSTVERRSSSLWLKSLLWAPGAQHHHQHQQHWHQQHWHHFG